jgi:ribosomal protein S12 methylthiotransferase accessory factor YcaO
LVAQPNGTTNALLSWTDAARATGYRIFVWMGTYWNPVAVVAAGTTQYNVSGLTAGATNWLMVESYTTNYAETAYSSAVFVNL